MTTVNVGKASVTDELSGGYSYEITIPKTARERNKALRESLKLVLDKENEIKKLREQLASAKSDGIREAIQYATSNHTKGVIAALRKYIELLEGKGNE